jgi:ATP-binding cassette, subfamily B, bacterial
VRKRPRIDLSSDPLSGTDDEMVTPAWRSKDLEQQAHNASLWAMIRRLPQFARFLVGLAWQAFPATTIMVATTNLVSGLASGVSLYSATNVLREILTTSPTPARLVTAAPSVAIVVAALVVQRGADILSQYGIQRISARLERLAERHVTQAALHVDLAAYDDSKWLDALELAYQSGTNHVDGAFNRLVTALGSLAGLIATASTVALLDPLLLPALLLSVLPDSLAALHISRLLYASMRRTSSLRRRRWLITRLPRDDDPAAEIRAYQVQPWLLAELDRIAIKLETEEINLARLQARVRATGRLLGGLGLGAAYGLLILFVATGRIPLAVAGGAIIAIQIGRSRLEDVILAVNRLYEEGLYVNEYQRFLADAQARTRPATDRVAPAHPSRYRIDSVTYRYTGAERDSLHNVSIEFGRGEIIALVGENGSGKTTLAKLIAGLYQPSSGAIFWDDTEIASVDPESVYDRIGMVMQDPIHFPTTLRQNITLGRLNLGCHDEERFQAAARASGADEIAEQLVRGWDTRLSRQFEGGVRLSGGQEQRLAVGRALFRDADLLLCDEPTANLDPRAEAAVYDSLARLAEGRTCVLITHRLASVRMASRIFVLHQGQLIEQGTHEELMALGGNYAELYAIQAASYLDDVAAAASSDESLCATTSETARR